MQPAVTTLNPFITGPARIHLDRIIADPNNVYSHPFQTLKKFLDGGIVFSEADQKALTDGLTTPNYDLVVKITRKKEQCLFVEKVFFYTFNTLALLVVWGVSMVWGVAGLLPFIPLVFTAIGKFFGTGMVGGLLYFTTGLTVTCTLYRYVFKQAYQVLAAALFAVARPILDNVLYCVNDVYAFFSGLAGRAWGWAKSVLAAQGLPTSAEQECMLPICNLTKSIKHFGGIITVQKLGALLVTVLLALNATHEFVDTQGVRLAIVSRKDFPDLPTVSEQQFRIARQPQEDGARIKMDIPKSPFQEKAEFKAEQEKRKPDESSNQAPVCNTWKAFFYGWGVWGVQTAGEHFTVYAFRTIVNKIYTWAFNGRWANAQPVARAVASALAGVVTTQVMDESTTVVGIAACFVTTAVWNGLGWLMSSGFDHIFRAAASAQPAGNVIGRQAPPSSVSAARHGNVAGTGGN
jgi:hypothetical protein